MAETKEKLIEWLQTLPSGTMVGVDDGGLRLQGVGDLAGAYYEIGGISERTSWVRIWDNAMEIYHPDICKEKSLSVMAQGEWPPGEDADDWLEFEAPDGKRWDTNLFLDPYSEEIDVYVYPVSCGRTITTGMFLTFDTVERHEGSYEDIEEDTREL